MNECQTYEGFVLIANSIVAKVIQAHKILRWNGTITTILVYAVSDHCICYVLRRRMFHVNHDSSEYTFEFERMLLIFRWNK